MSLTGRDPLGRHRISIGRRRKDGYHSTCTGLPGTTRGSAPIASKAASGQLQRQLSRAIPPMLRDPNPLARIHVLPISKACAGEVEPAAPSPPAIHPTHLPSVRKLLLSVAVCLFMSGSSQASAVDPSAPSDEQVAAAVVAVERLLTQGRAAEALGLIRPISEARPDSEQAVFSTALAAIATGEAAVRAGAKPKKAPAKEHFDLAISSLREMLVKDPGRLRVRLELGRALFSRGNCIQPPGNLITHLLGDDCWAAEQHFLRVLGADVPPTVVMNVRRYIQVCRARKRASGSLSLSLAPDTNVNTSTSAQTVNIFGLPFQLNEEARATSGIGVVGAFGAEVQHPLPFKLFPKSVTRLRVGGQVYRRDYSGGEFDDSNYGIYAGPRFLSNRGQMSVLFQADRRSVNGLPYSRQYGVRVEGVRLVVPKLWVGGSAEASRQTALSLNGPVGKPGLSWNTQAFANYSILPSLGIRFMGGSGREQTDRFSTRHSSRWVGVMGNYDLPLGFTLTAAQQMFLTNFEQPNRLFSPDPPETKLWFSRLAFHNRLIQIKGFSPSLSLIREDRKSNITIYGYQRYRVEAGFVRVF